MRYQIAGRISDYRLHSMNARRRKKAIRWMRANGWDYQVRAMYLVSSDLMGDFS